MNQIRDFIVIGSGFGGSVSTLRLARKGYNVLCIEQGKRYEPGEYAKTNWDLRKYLWLPQLGMYGIQKLSFYKQVSILTGTGVGGGSLVYANTLFKPKSTFFNNGEWGKIKPWEKILEPYYNRSGEMMGRVLYSKINPEDKALRNVAKKMGVNDSFQNVFVGVYMNDKEEVKDPYFSGEGPKRNPCVECAGCMVGCNDNAKNTLDKNYLFFAEKHGASILSETRVYKIEKTADGYRVYTKSILLGKQNKQVYECKKVIISAGTLGTLNLLLRQKFKYKTLQKLPDSLGKNLLTNSETLCAVSGAREKLNNGLAITSVFHPDEHTHIEVVKYPNRSNGMKMFFSLSADGSRNSLLRTLKLIGNTLRQPHKFLKTIFNFNWSENMVIFLVMQTLDNAMSMVWKKSLFGGRTSIKNKGNEKVPSYIAIGQKVMHKYAEEVNGIAQNIILEVMFNKATTAHILGGIPMSINPEKGVVNDYLEVHNYPGMYIIDGSIIQNNPGVNPSFSILAMAEYAMDNIDENKIKA